MCSLKSCCFWKVLFLFEENVVLKNVMWCNHQVITHARTHARTHVCWFLWFMGTLHRRNGFYCTNHIFYRPTTTLHLPLTGNFVHFYFLKKTHSVWFISLLNYGDTEIVLLKSPSPCNTYAIPYNYTNLCPHKPHKHAQTHARTYTHTHTHTHTGLTP